MLKLHAFISENKLFRWLYMNGYSGEYFMATAEVNCVWPFLTATFEKRWGSWASEATGSSRCLHGKEPAAKAGDSGLIPGSGRSPGEESGNPLQYSRLENPMDRGAWWAAVQGVTKSWTRLSDWTQHTCLQLFNSEFWRVFNKDGLPALIYLKRFFLKVPKCRANITNS